MFDNLNGIESLCFRQKQDIKITLLRAVERGSFLASEQISPLRGLNAFNYESVVDQIPRQVRSIDINWVDRRQLSLSSLTGAVRRLGEQRGWTQEVLPLFQVPRNGIIVNWESARKATSVALPIGAVRCSVRQFSGRRWVRYVLRSDFCLRRVSIHDRLLKLGLQCLSIELGSV